jgi:NAD(P)-dependent dehydrogenase (short-subunit alcohol dehydrogenase family)
MTTDPFSVADRIAVVTGGLGLLGRHYARALGERGARVAILDRTDDPGMEAGDRLMPIKADVTDRTYL